MRFPSQIETEGCQNNPVLSSMDGWRHQIQTGAEEEEEREEEDRAIACNIDWTNGKGRGERSNGTTFSGAILRIGKEIRQL